MGDDMNGKSGRKRTAVALLIAVIMIAAFIFSQSLPDSAASVAESGRVLELVRPILAAIFGEERVTNYFVRKLAHFAEFFALGAAVGGFLRARGSKRVQSYVNGLYFCGTWALTDETIQMFTNRNSQVRDVWIDICGAAAGMALVTIIRLLIYFAFKREKE